MSYTEWPESESDNTSEIDRKILNDNLWAIRPCSLYSEEYNDCKSIKGRFHQYFIHGESTDCSQWKRDYDSCMLLENNPKNIEAAKNIIQSEKERRDTRFKAHYGNKVWSKRSNPPDDWVKPLPEWLQEKNKNTLLELKAKEGPENSQADRTLCSIM